MSNPTLKDRLEEVLLSKNTTSENLNSIDRDSIDEICDGLGINILEKAYILGFDAKMIFNESFLKGITFLELNRKGDNLSIWKCLLKIKAN